MINTFKQTIGNSQLHVNHMHASDTRPKQVVDVGVTQGEGIRPHAIS